MSSISGFGLLITLTASNTYPLGVTLTQFADDTDPFDIPSMQIADKAMGLNGDLLTWTRATPINISISVVPNSDEDIILSILLQSNRAGKGKIVANDVINLVGIYPDGSNIQLKNGRLTDGSPGSPVASSGRLKSKTYTFTFENNQNT